MSDQETEERAGNSTQSDSAPIVDPSTWAPRILVEMHALSHPGKVRERNEDVYLLARVERSFTTLQTNLTAGLIPDRHLDDAHAMVVADGMGGMAAGEVASQLAVSTLVSQFLGTSNWIMRTGTWENRTVLDRMTERYRRANTVVHALSEAHPQLSGMGTTMTLAFNVGAELFVGHIGDSRAYLYRRSELHQLTRDHTLAVELAEAGLISPDAVATHHLRHVLTHALGQPEVGEKAEVQKLPLEDGDRVLVCSDGLTNMVEDDAIAKILASDRSVSEMCNALLDAALESGGKDNVTIALAHFRRRPAPA
jgi:protein phosphatase